MYQQDYIKRQVELFAAALATLASKRAAGALEEAQEAVRAAYSALGIDALLLRLDPASLVRTIQSPEKVRALCELMDQEALLMEALSKQSHAVRLRQQAASIRGALGT